MAIDAALAAHFGLAEARRDPLASYLWSSPKARRLVEYLADYEEVVVRGGNMSSKTFCGAMLAAAALSGRTSIDGRSIREAERGVAAWQMPLPVYPCPHVGLVMVSSYKQSAESTVSALMRLIGERPHHVVSAGALSVQAVYVRDARQGDEPNWRRWNRALFFPSDGAPPEGIRAHWAWGDETPTRRIWDEVRRRRTARQAFRRWITHTPIDPAKWEWLREELEQSHAPEVVLRVLDNEALNDADKAAIVRDLEYSDLRDARLDGAYVSLVGASPWRGLLDVFPDIEARCRPPKTEAVEVWAERIDGRPGEFATCMVEVYEPPRVGHVYYGLLDPSLGVDDPEHDPCGMHIHDQTEPALVTRYNGFCGGYALGMLGAWACEWYNDALVWPDVTGGYGGPTLTALSQYQSERHPHGYRLLGRDRRSEREGEPERRPGFTFTSDNKAEALEAVKLWLRRRGETFAVPSRAAVQMIARATLDKHGRLMKQGSTRYEDCVLLGYGLRLLAQYGRQVAPEPTVEDRVRNLLRGTPSRALMRPSWAVTPRVRSM